MDLPLLLAGPILRRVDASGCSVWIALSEQRTVTVTLWQGLRVAGDSPGTVEGAAAPLVTSEAVELRAFGEHLYVGVITVPLGVNQAVLLPATLYSYDLTLSGDGEPSGLRQLGLLKDGDVDERIEHVDVSAPSHLALGYVENRLPSFVSPPAVADQLRIAHASCRKSNGPSSDAMAWLDDQIEEHQSDADSDNRQRLQQLFLTGDQIYADDVAGSLLPMLNELGTALVGDARTEKLTLGDTAFDATLANFPALRRQRLVRESGGLSSTAAKNHLLTFGEYAAMYLAVWSPHVWRSLADVDTLLTPATISALPEGTLDDELLNADQINARYSSLLSEESDEDKRSELEDKRKKALEKRQALEEDMLPEEHRRVVQFRASVPKVARALANVPTYMIFDDHEITDDWNLNQRWRNRVFGNALGKAIVRNGMMAYGVFQGWGNNPSSFVKAEDKNRKFLEETLEVLGAEGTVQSEVPGADTDALDELIGVTEAQDSKRANWNYQVKGPVHRICVLDTRTRRRFEGQGIGPPDLLGGTLKKQVPTVDGSEVFILVSPVPVLGPQLIETIGAPVYNLIGDFMHGLQKARKAVDEDSAPERADVGAETADAESWTLNEVGREKLLDRLAPHKRVIILSGDVHYGLSMRMDYWKGTDSASVPILQLTSSPSRNTFLSLVEALVRHDARLQQYQDGFKPEVLGWNKANPLSIPAGIRLDPGKRSRHARNPAILDSHNWPTGVSIPAGQQPDWRWRVQLLSDKRPRSALPVDSPTLGLPEIDDELVLATDDINLRLYSALLSKHQQAALRGNFHLLRRIVFTDNIGLVSLLDADGELSVQHTLLSRPVIDNSDADGSETTFIDKGVPNTVHVTPLVATSDPAPQLVFDA